MLNISIIILGCSMSLQDSLSEFNKTYKHHAPEALNTDKLTLDPSLTFTIGILYAYRIRLFLLAFLVKVVSTKFPTLLNAMHLCIKKKKVHPKMC